MNVNEELRNIHKEIQQRITKMIPEKYKKICLYASVSEGRSTSSGEMFFYYFPSGILKKNPINVYEIPELFDFEEAQYRELASALYESIRKLKKYCVKIGQKAWSNVTITIAGTKYITEYNYDDLTKSDFDNYERHIIWRYKYLNIPIESFSKREKEIIKAYVNSKEFRNAKYMKYEENIYEKQVNKIAIYSNEENQQEYIRKEEEKKSNENTVKSQILNF